MINKKFKIVAGTIVFAASIFTMTACGTSSKEKQTLQALEDVIATSPQNNGASNGNTSNNSASNGNTSNNSASNGNTSNNSASNGNTSNNSASNGNASNNGTSNGNTSNNSASNGNTSNNSASNGNAANDSASNNVSNSSSGNSNNSDENQKTQTVTAKGYSINVIDGCTYVDGILIANKTYTLPSTYAPGDVLPEVKSAFSKMQADAANAGLNIYISSGYRSYSRQEVLYNNYVKTDGQALADTYSSRPGHSEHQTGMCFDLNSIDDSFSNTPESAWVEQHAHEYGFIIRYPKGKETQTGYQYESWHLRYLGVDKATQVYNSGLCLEEFLGITSQYDN